VIAGTLAAERERRLLERLNSEFDRDAVLGRDAGVCDG
jgi:hypothetical protein